MLVVLPTGKITDERTTYGLLDTYRFGRNAGLPSWGDPHGNGVLVVVRGRESLPQGGAP